MSKQAAKRLKQFASALALLGVLQHIWLLAVHTTSPLLALGGAGGAHAAACHHDCHDHAHMAAHHGDSGAPDKSQAPKTSCPICLGLASLNLAILDQPIMPAPLKAGVARIQTIVVEIKPAQLSSTIHNRGPPALT